MALQNLNVLKQVSSCGPAARTFVTSASILFQSPSASVSNSVVTTSIIESEPLKPQNSIRPIMHKNWDWEFVVGAKAGRKPALKRPKAHQWYYCNPKYNPNDPLPTKIFPPHAPPTAESLDDWSNYKKLCPKDPSEARKFRKHFLRFLHQRNYDWKYAFEKGLAQEVKAAKAAERVENETKRQDAWNAYRAEVFERALKE